MKIARFLKLAGVYLLCALPATAAPEVRGIVNAASYAPAGMPNSGIAQGSMFIVFGSELGPVQLRYASGFPLPTELGGTSIRVTVGATTVDALLLYVWFTQVAAILPSTTPEGVGLLELTYNRRTSQAGAFRVVRSAPGVLAQNQAGSGPALAEFYNSPTDHPRNSLIRPARAGQVVTLWATGLGPISENDAMPPIQRDMNINLQVFAGGKPAVVRYKGRSGCCSGLDQIVFEVPSGVSGCHVPVVVQVDDMVSNFTTISVADSSDINCMDLSGISGPAIEKLQRGGTLRIGSVALGVMKSEYVMEIGMGQFFDTDLNWLAYHIPLGLSSPGSCMVGPANFPVTYQQGPIQTIGLDAGRQLTVNGPKGSRQILQRWPGGYTEVFANGTIVQFLEPGTYTVDNGSGGADVGPFRSTIRFPSELTSSVQSSPAGTTVTWTGGDPEGFVVIQGAAQSPQVRTSFSCVERASAGRFAIPAHVLASLPGPVSELVTFIAAGSSPQNRFQAAGLDLGYFSFCSPVSVLCGNYSFGYW